MAVNAPEAGTIKEFLVNEEDTVTVGQDIVRLELGGAPKEGGAEKPAAPESKEAAPKDSAPAPAPEKAPEPKQETKPAAAPAPTPAKKETPAKEAPATLGNREERRVSTRLLDERRGESGKLTHLTGQDEPHAPPHRRASQAVPEHRCLAYHLQRS